MLFEMMEHERLESERERSKDWRKSEEKKCREEEVERLAVAKGRKVEGSNRGKLLRGQILQDPKMRKLFGGVLPRTSGKGRREESP